MTRWNCWRCDAKSPMSVVTVYPDDLTYNYQCRSCGLASQRTTNRKVIDALIAHGAIVARRLADRSTGPPFTPDDLLDLHEALADDRMVALALATLGATS